MQIYFLFLILIVVAISAVFILSSKLPKYSMLIVIFGSVISFLAILTSQTMSLVYALLLILGLSFATAVLLSKMLEAE